MTSIHGEKDGEVMRNLWGWWESLWKKITYVQARIVLSLFYFVVLAPFAVVLRLLSDPLAIKPGRPREWCSLGDGKGSPMEQARRQF